MKTSKTPLSNTKVYLIEGKIYRAVVPFEDDSSLEILFSIETNSEDISPCTSADKFIYSSLSKEIQCKIFSLCMKLL